MLTQAARRFSTRASARRSASFEEPQVTRTTNFSRGFINFELDLGLPIGDKCLAMRCGGTIQYALIARNAI